MLTKEQLEQQAHDLELELKAANSTIERLLAEIGKREKPTTLTEPGTYLEVGLAQQLPEHLHVAGIILNVEEHSIIIFGIPDDYMGKMQIAKMFRDVSAQILESLK